MKRFLTAVAGLVGLLVLILTVNHVRLNQHARAAVEGRPDVDVLSYYRFGVMPNEIVYDIRGVGAEASPASVIGGFFEFAGALKDREFAAVWFASNGKLKFRLGGADFRTIGQEHLFQNPLYVLRTLPEKLETPDGRPAFSVWTGGALGVMNAQMDDFNTFTKRWWLDDVLADFAS